MSKAWFYHITREGKLLQVETVEAALSAVKEGGFIWLDYCQPTREELTSLIEPLDLHPLSIEDCFDVNQIPKIEDFPRNTFIIFNSIRFVNGELSIEEIDLFLGDNPRERLQFRVLPGMSFGMEGFERVGGIGGDACQYLGDQAAA